jgi:hypothetical protein
MTIVFRKHRIIATKYSLLILIFTFWQNFAPKEYQRQAQHSAFNRPP